MMKTVIKPTAPSSQSISASFHSSSSSNASCLLWLQRAQRRRHQENELGTDLGDKVGKIIGARSVIAYHRLIYFESESSSSD